MLKLVEMIENDSYTPDLNKSLLGKRFNKTGNVKVRLEVIKTLFGYKLAVNRGNPISSPTPLP